MDCFFDDGGRARVWSTVSSLNSVIAATANVDFDDFAAVGESIDPALLDDVERFELKGVEDGAGVGGP